MVHTSAVALALFATEKKVHAFVLTSSYTRGVFKTRSIDSSTSLHATEETVDSLDFFEDNFVYPPTSQQAQWDISDDWSKLSRDNVVSAYSPSDFAVMDQANQILQDHAEFSNINDWQVTIDDNANTSNLGSQVETTTEIDDLVANAIETITCNFDSESDGVQLYDTMSSLSTKVEPDYEADEISLMIRCNQTPQQFLIDQGRALPVLTNEMKYSAGFLFEKSSDSAGSLQLPLHPKMTNFFKHGVKQMFNTYSVHSGGEQILDRNAIAKWMETCVNSSHQTPKKLKIGAHDTSISALLSRYSNTHGSGRLTCAEFQNLYCEVAWSGYVRDIRENKVKYQTDSKSPFQTPSADVGVLFHDKKNTVAILKEASIELVWRDLEAHGIFSPAEKERVQLLKELQSLVSASQTLESDLLIDECELFDEYEDRLAHQTYSDENDNDLVGVKRDWGLVGKKEKSSFQLVEMTGNGKVPKRMRDGQFCFIDEESCIGCLNCINIAPSSFKMIEDSGRARTFYQRASSDVESAVLSCPVSCMHMVSFDELKELEIARDIGDGRTDHKHFGHGKSHKPLHVSRRDSDANHKSSWYHYLKGKCAGSRCPQRGCYDCPKYRNPGENPFFIERHEQSERIRAQDFIDCGEAEKWRKIAEL